LAAIQEKTGIVGGKHRKVTTNTPCPERERECNEQSKSDLATVGSTKVSDKVNARDRKGKKPHRPT